MKVLVCVIAALCSVQLSMAIVCLPNACDNADCSAAHAELMSCEGRIDPAGGMCGCCPACIKQLNEGESCEHNMLGTPSKFECSRGLQCHPGTKKCVKTETLVKGPCHAEVLEKSEYLASGMVGVHLPECLEDGSYAPVQCREAVCTCVDKKGKQLYGIEASVGRHNEMNCQCARDKDARKLSMIAFERKCDEIGNYERVQCSRGVCFCVNAHGQKIQSFGERPEESKHELGGCLERKRRHAVEQGACARELEMIEGQGHHRPGQHKPQCLEDGSYAPLQCREAVCSCVDSAGRPTGHSANVGKANQMSCACARDQADYMKTGMMGKTFSCDELGNYSPIQCIGSVCHCVDNKGNKLEAIEAVPIHMISSLKCDAQANQQGACARELEMLSQGPTMLGARKPTCLEDGTYHPRQCFGSVCTCVDSEGLETEVSAHISQASQMGCACARDAADYYKTGLIGRMFFCDELGNYKSQSNVRQAVEQGACARELEMLSQGPTMLGARKPTCLEDGSYHPRQCFGSVCTCVDSAGIPTETSAHIGKASQMGCACARDAADYFKTGLIGNLFFCDELGNYKTQSNVRQAVEQGACARELELLSQGPTMLGARKPTCLEDGSYHPRQCFGSVCTCVDSEGKSTGISAPISQASEMQCACARAKADYKKTGMVGLIHQCDELGNFSPVQCIGSMCHCVDTLGNKLEAIEAVSISEFASLPCAKPKGACARELEMLSQGPTMLGARKPTCLEDGTYHPRQCFGSVCTCVDSEGKSTGISAPISQASQMGCACARDKADYKKTGMVGKWHSCDNLGNYNKIQCLGSVCHCVDQVGNRLESSPSVSIGEISSLRC